MARVVTTQPSQASAKRHRAELGPRNLNESRDLGAGDEAADCDSRTRRRLQVFARLGIRHSKPASCSAFGQCLWRPETPSLCLCDGLASRPKLYFCIDFLIGPTASSYFAILLFSEACLEVCRCLLQFYDAFTEPSQTQWFNMLRSSAPDLNPQLVQLCVPVADTIVQHGKLQCSRFQTIACSIMYLQSARRHNLS